MNLSNKKLILFLVTLTLPSLGAAGGVSHKEGDTSSDEEKRFHSSSTSSEVSSASSPLSSPYTSPSTQNLDDLTESPDTRPESLAIYHSPEKGTKHPRSSHSNTPENSPPHKRPHADSSSTEESKVTSYVRELTDMKRNILASYQELEKSPGDTNILKKIEKIREDFHQIVKEFATLRPNKIQPIISSFTLSETDLVLNEFDPETTLHGTLPSTLYMNFKVYDLLKKAVEDPRYQDKALPVVLKLINYFLSLRDEDSFESQDAEQKTEWLEMIDTVSTLQDNFAQKTINSKNNTISPLYLYRKGEAKVTDISKSNNKEKTWKEASNYYLDSYILGYHKALFSINDKLSEDNFPYYYFAAYVQNLPEGYWGIGQLIKKNLLIKNEYKEAVQILFSSIKNRRVELKDEDFFKVPSEPSEYKDYPVSPFLLVDEAFSLAKSFKEQGKAEKASQIYKELGQRGYIEAYSEDQALSATKPKQFGEFITKENLQNVKKIVQIARSKIQNQHPKGTKK